MGGSSSQTIGQRYFAKLTTFIGNPIEKLIGINFDNRGWIFKPDNEESFLRVESPNLYGDKEGGVAGFIDIHTGTADQLPNTTYTADFPKVSGYPFQSYLVFRGLGRRYVNGNAPGTIIGIIAQSKHYNNSFYHGNSGYMKEMLLWVKRTRVRNDGREQWYEVRGDGAIVCEIGAYSFNSDSNEFLYNGPFEVKCVTEVSPQNESARNFYSEYEYTGIFNESDLVGGGWHIGSTDTDFVRSKSPINYSLIYSFPGFNGTANIVFRVSNYLGKNDWQIFGTLAEEYRQETGTDGMVYIYCKFIVPKEGICQVGIKGTRKIDDEGLTEFGVTVMARMYECFTRPDSTSIEAPDINPIHKIREILTDDTAMNKPESDINDVNFKKAADVLYTEKLGISWSVTEKSCLEAINELCGHIEAGVRMNRQTGLYEMVLFRDDWFAENEVHTLPVNKIKGMQLDGATSADELINKLNVSYYNQSAIKNSSFSIAENAAIRNLKGHENADEVKFPYCMKQRNAAVVAQWKLKQMSTPVWQGTLTTGFYEARKWNRYDLLRLEWPRRWNGTILVRIMKINLGTGTDVSIDFVEVVPYSGNLSSNIVNDTPVDTTPKPPQPALFKAFELSYLEAVQLNGQKAVDEALAYNPDAGYAAVIAQRPQSNSLNALMYTDIGNDFERAGAIVYSETAELDQNISRVDTTFILKNAGDIDMVSTGTQITVNNEIMVYQSYDEETGLLTVKRGALDTVPQNHLAGSVLYFADDFITVDPTEYVTGEIINVKALTTTPSGILGIDDVDMQQVEIQARAIRPYPPANVKINGEYWPEYIDGRLLLTWSDRNRLQQTGGEILGYFDGSVTLEPNTQTLLTVTELDVDDIELATHSINATGTNTFVLEETYMQIGVRALHINLKTVRDGYDCINAFDHTVRISNLIAPQNVTFEVIEL